MCDDSRHNGYSEKIKNKFGDKYKLLSKYEGSKYKVFVLNNECNHSYEIRADHLLNGVKCKQCSYSNRAKTHEMFEEEVRKKHGDSYVLLSKYENARKKVKVQHDCGEIYEALPSTLLKSGCRKCHFLKKKKTHGDFLKEVYELVGDEYTVNSKYKGNDEKITMTHSICENKYEVKPSNFLQGNRCPFCANTIRAKSKWKHTKEEFERYFFDLVGDEFEIESDYKGSVSPIQIKHIVCDYSYYTTPKSFASSKNKCPLCSGASGRKLDNKAFKKRIYDAVGDEYSLLGEYVSARSKVEILHNNCGKKWLYAPYAFIGNGVRCPHCAGNARWNTDDYKRKMYQLVKDEYTLLESYTGANNKSLIRHNTCGYEYSTTPSMFIRGTRCPKCCETKGEKRISDILDTFDMPYERQYMFDDCIYAKRLKFDFCVFSKESIILIEFDGIQHFEPIEFFGGEKAFKENLMRDSIKNEYCDKNNIKLIRIPYWEYDDIEKILTNELEIVYA